MNPELLPYFNVLFLGIAAALPASLPAVVSAVAMQRGGPAPSWREIAAWCALLYLWFAAALLVTQPSIFGVSSALVKQIGFPVMFVGGILVGSLLIGLHPTVRKRVVATPLHWPVALQSVRVIGGAFIVWATFGQASWRFALTAGIGDLVVGLTAPLVVRAMLRYPVQARRLARGHTLLGLADFALAIGTAFSVGGRVAWPGTLIPNYLVPIAILIHIWTLALLWRTRDQR